MEATPALAGRAVPLEAGFPGRCPGLMCLRAVGAQNVQTPRHTVGVQNGQSPKAGGYQPAPEFFPLALGAWLGFLIA
jgi:hypothetical protein